MPIKKRLLLAAALNLLVIALFAWFAYSAVAQLNQSIQQISRQTIPVMMEIENMRFLAMRIVSSTSEQGLLDQLESQTGFHNLEQDLINQGVDQLLASLEQYETLVTTHFKDEIKFIQPLKTKANNLIEISRQFRDPNNQRESLIRLKNALEVAEQQILAQLNAIRSYEQRELLERRELASSNTQRLQMILLIGLALILLVSTLLAWDHGMRILQPLRRLKHATNDLANGQLPVQPVKVQSDDEIGALTAAFNTMSQTLAQQQFALRDAHQYTENILDVMLDMLFTTSANGIIKTVNSAVCKQLNYEQESLIGQDICRLLTLNGKPVKHPQLIRHALGSHIECALINHKGNAVSVLLSMNHIESQQQHGDYLVVATNISERKVAEEKIHKLAYYDVLTGLPNRSLFSDRLKQAIAQCNEDDSALAVLFIDIDNFKSINDALGHVIGDGMLRKITDILSQTLRDTTLISHESIDTLPTISRHGGDEFLILLPHAEREHLVSIAINILQQLNIKIQVEDHEIFTTASLGLAIYPDHADNDWQLIQNADTALYHAKSAGKNQLAMFRPEMVDHVIRHRDIENSLRNAIENEEFSLCFQPQFDIRNRQVVGMEALIRWHHPEWSLVSPLEFIPIAENNGLIMPIGEWVLHEACKQWVTWHKQGFEPGHISINLSATQFKSPDLIQTIDEVLLQTRIPPDVIVLEITESVLMQDAEYTHHQLQYIRNRGIRVSIDDFGTGYSALSYLKHFSLDYIKIDRSFVRDIESSKNDQEIVRTIINMASNLELELVCEGIETRGQLNILQQAGCHILQGSFLSPPVTAKDYQQQFLSQDSKQPDLSVV